MAFVLVCVRLDLDFTSQPDPGGTIAGFSPLSRHEKHGLDGSASHSIGRVLLSVSGSFQIAMSVKTVTKTTIKPIDLR